MQAGRVAAARGASKRPQAVARKRPPAFCGLCGNPHGRMLPRRSKVQTGCAAWHSLLSLSLYAAGCRGDSGEPTTQLPAWMRKTSTHHSSLSAWRNEGAASQQFWETIFHILSSNQSIKSMMKGACKKLRVAHVGTAFYRAMWQWVCGQCDAAGQRGYAREDRSSQVGLRCGLGGLVVWAGLTGSWQNPPACILS